MEKLRIGKIPFLNLYPIYRIIEMHRDCSGYEFVEDYPSALNRMLRERKIDVSPSSSVEYLRHNDLYSIIDGHSISAGGPVKSILLFSQLPIEKLKGSEIFVTSQSETSVALLDIIMSKFYDARCFLEPTAKPARDVLKKGKPFMAIGDDALRTAYEASRPGESKSSGLQGRMEIYGAPLYVYDLADIWHEFTGLPFVFALWIHRRGLSEKKLSILSHLREDLSFARGYLASHVLELAAEVKTFMPEEEVVSYWQGITYGLGKKEKKGMELFRNYLEESGRLIRA